jgi:hypothetical protein
VAGTKVSSRIADDLQTLLAAAAADRVRLTLDP